jgi:hypothetical protein
MVTTQTEGNDEKTHPPHIFLGASSVVKNGLSGSPAATTSIAAVPVGAAVVGASPLPDAFDPSGKLSSSHADAAASSAGVPLREGGVAEPPLDSVLACRMAASLASRAAILRLTGLREGNDQYRSNGDGGAEEKEVAYALACPPPLRRLMAVGLRASLVTAPRPFFVPIGVFSSC